MNHVAGELEQIIVFARPYATSGRLIHFFFVFVLILLRRSIRTTMCVRLLRRLFIIIALNLPWSPEKLWELFCNLYGLFIIWGCCDI